MGITNSLGTLLDFALGIYTWMIIGRILLSWVNPDPYNPIVQFLIKATDPVLEPLRRLIPPLGGMDFSPIVALIGISFLQKIAVSLSRSSGGESMMSSFLVEILSVVHLFSTFYLMLLLVRAGFHLYSWLSFKKDQPFRIDLNHPITRFVFQSTEPAIKPMRNWLPRISGMDVSPLAAALALIFLLSLMQDIIMSLTPMAMIHG